jgi:CRP-like cAMP-binding protein
MLLLFLEKSTLSGLRQILAQRLLALANMFGEKQGDAIAIRARLSQEELGKMVGASRQSINKELSYLQEQNILQLLPDGFLLKDPEALKQLC